VGLRNGCVSKAMNSIKIPQMGEVEVTIEPCRVCRSDKLKIFEYSKEVSPAGRFWDNDDYQDAVYENMVSIRCLKCGYTYEGKTPDGCVSVWNNLDPFSVLDSIEYIGKLNELILKLMEENKQLDEELAEMVSFVQETRE
jgi:hypothetical protein